MISSMTGFARSEKGYLWGHVSCEIRSVNHRYLELNIKLPDALRVAEGKLREILKSQLGRGKVDVLIYVKQEPGQTGEIDEHALRSLAASLDLVQQYMPTASPSNTLDILQAPGIVKAKSPESSVLLTAVEPLLEQALLALKKNRLREGESLYQCLDERLAAIMLHVDTLKSRLPKILFDHQERFKNKLANLKNEIDPDRLEQEIVIQVQKADVSEEIDRLEAHVKEARAILEKKEPVGRRLDFLMQEFNREANTLSSKSISSETTRIAMELKVLIEQMREQVQNIE